MKFGPARNSIVILLSACFLILSVIIVLGAAYYKFGGAANLDDQISDQQSDLLVQPEFVQATLALVPTESPQEYRMIVKDLTAPVTSIAFQLESSSPIISSSKIKLDSSLINSNWTSAINSITDSTTGQILSFSLLHVNPEDQTLISELSIGVIQLSAGADIASLSLNDKESYVSFLNSEIPAKLVLITNTNQ